MNKYACGRASTAERLAPRGCNAPCQVYGPAVLLATDQAGADVVCIPTSIIHCPG